MGQDYPMMIYHIATEQNKIINNQVELIFWESHGWTKNYLVYDTVTSAQKKIEWHKEEIERLKKVLADYNYSLETAEKNVLTVNAVTDTQEAPPEPRKETRGRPRKAGG